MIPTFDELIDPLLKLVSNVIFDQFKKGEVALNFGDLAINLEGSFCLKNGDIAI